MANSQRHSALPVRGESDRTALLRPRTRALAALSAAAAIMAVTICGVASPAAAQDAAAGREKALQCQACHGLDGLAKVPGTPHLAGQVEEYLAKALRDYKSGARQGYDPVMVEVVQSLDDSQLVELSYYLARSR
jgi:cytochrome c553